MLAVVTAASQKLKPEKYLYLITEKVRSDAEKIDIKHLGAFARAVAERQRHREIPSKNRASEHLANEMTERFQSR